MHVYILLLYSLLYHRCGRCLLPCLFLKFIDGGLTKCTIYIILKRNNYIKYYNIIYIHQNTIALNPDDVGNSLQ